MFFPGKLYFVLSGFGRQCDGRVWPTVRLDALPELSCFFAPNSYSVSWKKTLLLSPQHSFRNGKRMVSEG